MAVVLLSDPPGGVMGLVPPSFQGQEQPVGWGTGLLIVAGLVLLFWASVRIVAWVDVKLSAWRLFLDIQRDLWFRSHGTDSGPTASSSTEFSAASAVEPENRALTRPIDGGEYGCSHGIRCCCTDLHVGDVRTREPGPGLRPGFRGGLRPIELVRVPRRGVAIWSPRSHLVCPCCKAVRSGTGKAT